MQNSATDIWSKLMIVFLIIFVLTTLFLEGTVRHVVGVVSLLLMVLSCTRMSFDKVVLEDKNGKAVKEGKKNEHRHR
jgi:uncharacterized membrane protein